jgi:hypothetical protein
MDKGYTAAMEFLRDLQPYVPVAAEPQAVKFLTQEVYVYAAKPALVRVEDLVKTLAADNVFPIAAKMLA